VEAIGQLDALGARGDHARAHQPRVARARLLAQHLEAVAGEAVEVGGVVRHREVAEERGPAGPIGVAQLLPMQPDRLLGHERDVEHLLHHRLQAVEPSLVAERFAALQHVEQRRVEPLDDVARLAPLGAHGAGERAQDRRRGQRGSPPPTFDRHRPGL